MNQLPVEVADNAISPRIANHAIHFFDRTSGYSGGYFSDRLFELMSHADTATLAQIAKGFPAEVAAFQLAKNVGGLVMLRTIASMLHLVPVE